MIFEVQVHARGDMAAAICGQGQDRAVVTKPIEPVAPPRHTPPAPFAGVLIGAAFQQLSERKSSGGARRQSTSLRSRVISA